MAEELEIGPGGQRDPSRLHTAVPGNMIDAGGELAPRIAEANRAGRRLPEFTVRPALASASNWITAGWWLNTTGTPVSYFRTEWKVPPPPLTQVRQLVYLFNGMQPAKTSPLQTILQPVLEWGRIKGSWSVASWINPDANDQVHTSRRVRVEPGDTLVGVIRLCDQRKDLFTYSCEFEDIPDTRLCVCNLPELVWCVETLEAYERTGTPPYDLNSRSEYPDAEKTTFRRIRVKAEADVGPLDWDICISDAASFGECTEVECDSSTDGRVDIFYGDDSDSGATPSE
jgi:hypothetical protein